MDREQPAGLFQADFAGLGSANSIDPGGPNG
jgi:hypothetical protein